MKTKRQYFLILPFSIGLLIALFSPTDVLKYHWAKVVVDSMGTIIPMIASLKANFELTQVAQFYYSIMYFFVPIIYFLFDAGGTEKQLSEAHSHKVPFWIRYLFLLVLSPFLIWITMFVGIDPSTLDGRYPDGRVYFILHNRIFMGIYGGVPVFGVAALLKLLINWTSLMWKIYFLGD